MINLSKLKKVVQKDGKIEAQCPACAEAGADTTGNHFVLYPDGRFGCVANAGDKNHNKIILQLVGEKGVTPLPQLAIRRQIIPDSQVILKVGRPGRRKSAPVGTGGPASAPAPAPSPDEPAKQPPARPTSEDDSPGYTAEDVRRFLDEP